MSAESVFRACNFLAVGGWLLLIFAGRRRHVADHVTALVIPGALGSIYALALVVHWRELIGGFGSLGEIQSLFQNRWLLLAGWIHYLAFDLFVGSWEVRDATQHRFPHIFVVPSLCLTFLFGPIGFLSYILVKGVVFPRHVSDPKMPAVELKT